MYAIQPLTTRTTKYELGYFVTLLTFMLGVCLCELWLFGIGLRSLVIFIDVYTNWRDTEYTGCQHHFVTIVKNNERSLFYGTIKT